MADSVNLTVHRAAQLPGEDDFLNAVVDDLTNEDARLVYADWLEEQGDARRAKFLREYSRAFKSMDPNDFPSMRRIPDEWTRMIGAKLVYAIASQDLGKHRNKWLALAKPALNYSAKRTSDKKIPVGGTKLYGLPDLPPGTPWPRQKDCDVLYMDDSGIEPETLCSFVGQINLAELAGTHVARLCPPKGLVSIFSCAEIQSIGMVDACVIFTPETDDLVRTDRPPLPLDDNGKETDDEANELIAAQALQLSETLGLPAVDARSAFKEFRWKFGSDVADCYSEVQHASDFGDLEMILGYTHPTSGDDPLPGPDWCRLICVENSIRMTLHFCIRNADLAAANFHSMKLAWVDFD